MPQAIHISPIDNVVVALHPIAKGTLVEVDGLGPGDWLWAEAQQRERLAIPSAFEKFTAELKEGEWRLLTEAEVEALQRIRSGS